MIQRIQSVILFIAFLLDGGVFFNALYRHAQADPQTWVGIGFSLILTLAFLGSLACIFLYKNRQNQIKGINIVMVIQLLALGYGIGLLISLGGFGTFLWDETIGVMLLILALVSQLYARKKVKDDIELVKSMDRIR